MDLNGDEIMEKYYVDERVGCIAVREYFNVNYELSPGLNLDTPDVIKFWGGNQETESGDWYVDDKDRNAVNQLCESLNKKLDV